MRGGATDLTHDRTVVTGGLGDFRSITGLLSLRLVRAMEAAVIRPVVDRVIPFAEAPEAYRVLEEERPFGKVVIAFDGR